MITKSDENKLLEFFGGRLSTTRALPHEIELLEFYLSASIDDVNCSTARNANLKFIKRT